jgi:hypothetical protein
LVSALIYSFIVIAPTDRPIGDLTKSPSFQNYLALTADVRLRFYLFISVGFAQFFNPTLQLFSKGLGSKNKQTPTKEQKWLRNK